MRFIFFLLLSLNLQAQRKVTIHCNHWLPQLIFRTHTGAITLGHHIYISEGPWMLKVDSSTFMHELSHVMEYDSLKAFKFYTQYIWNAKEGYQYNKLEIWAYKYHPEVWTKYYVVWKEP